MIGEKWYQGDHSIFIQNQRPAMAITTERSREISVQIAQQKVREVSHDQ